jgi:hypothetical protein
VVVLVLAVVVVLLVVSGEDAVVRRACGCAGIAARTSSIGKRHRGRVRLILSRVRSTKDESTRGKI